MGTYLSTSAFSLCTSPVFSMRSSRRCWSPPLLDMAGDLDLDLDSEWWNGGEGERGRERK